MKTIALSTFRDRISSRLDAANEVLILSLENGTIRNRETIRIIPSSPLDKIQQVIQLNPDVLICGGLTQLFDNKLKNTSITVMPWIRGNTEEVLNKYLEGKLAGTLSICKNENLFQ